MEMCARCHKRVAVVYITKLENGNTVTEGICLKCARELGIKPVNDILEKMGVPEDALEELDHEIDNIEEKMSEMSVAEIPTEDGDPENGGAPSINLGQLFQNFGLGKPLGDPMGGKSTEKSDEAPKKEARKQQKLKYLTTYCRNLTSSAKEGKLDRIVGRARELDRVIQILSRRQKNNPCLIGEPGVGKTAIAEALAMKIAENNVPAKLRDMQVYLVDLTALVAGTQFRGQFESRIQGLINEVKQVGNAILVIDEVHNIVGAGEAEGAMNAANILKPALSRGEIQVIGATTMNEYRKYIEKDSALERRFQPVIVNEPSIEDSVEIIRGIKHYYEDFHQVKISDEVARRAVIMSERYITDRFLPDKAIDLIDEAAAHDMLGCTARDEYDTVWRALEESKQRLEALESGEENTDSDEERYRNIAMLKTEQLKLAERVDALRGDCEELSLTVNDLADVIEIWTGIPATAISENEFLRLDKLEGRLKQNIIGQDEAVSAAVRAIKRGRAGVTSKRKPVSFIFAGPTGVGKTELVKRLAADLFSSPDALIRVDMTEYMEKHAVSRLIGAPPGYVGHDDAGQLTEKIRRHPYSVVLFDEIEKAHPDVLNVLLQILDDGKVTDSHGRVVDFSNCILVMTTNAGSSVGTGRAGFGGEGGSLAENKTEKSLSEFLRPEFLNRIDEIITFRALEVPDCAKIAAIMLSELRDALVEKEIKFAWTDEAAALIAEKSYSRKYGARNLRRYIQTEVEDKLANEIISRYESGITAASLTVKDGALAIDII